MWNDTWDKPRHLVRQAAESFSTLPVGTDRHRLRRPVSATFRQRGGQFLLPPRNRVSRRPETAHLWGRRGVYEG